MKPTATLRSFLAIAGSTLLTISYSHGQTNLAHSYLTSLDVSSPVTLYPAGGFPSFMVGPLTGSSTLTIAGGFTQTTGVNGIVSLTNNGTSNTFSGNIIVESGTLRIAGSPFAANGGFTAPSMTSSNTITINRAGFLTIDDNATGTGGYTANRFGTGGSRPAVNLAGGTINLIGLNNASSSVQTFGALTSSSGQGTVNVSRPGSGTPTLTFSSLAINSGSLLSFNDNGSSTFGTAATNVPQITFADTTGLLTNGILAGARYYSGSPGTSDLVTYGANGVTRYTVYDVSSNNINAATSAQNVQIPLNTTAVALTGDVAVNSINFQGNGPWSLGGFKLTIGSGMFLRNGNNGDPTITNGTLTAGDGVNDIDLNIIVAQNNTTIQAVIADNALSAVTLVKSGDGRALNLNGGANNTYTGGTYVVGGDLVTGSVANRTYLGTGKVTVDGASFLNLQAIGTTSNATGDDFTATNGAKIQISNNNHGSVDTFNIGANSIIVGASGSGTGLASLTRGTNITLASGAIIAHSQQTAALNLTTGTIQNLGTSADLFYGLNGNQNNTGGQITIGSGTAFRGISTDRQDREWQQGTINIASGTTSVDFQGHAGQQNAVQLTLGNGPAPGNVTFPTITSAVSGTVDVRAIGRVQLNDDLAVYGNTGAGQNIRFVATAGSTLLVNQATGMGSGTGIASALVQNGGTLAIGNTAALNGAVTVEAGGQFNANQALGLTGAGTLTFNEGSIVLIGNATGFSGAQATSATINPGAIFRLGAGNFGTAGTTLDSILGSGSNHVSFIHTGNNPVNPTNPNTAVYTLNKSGGGIGGVLTDDGAGPTSNPAFTNNARTVSNTTNGHIALGANGGVIAATTNSTFTISENITGAGSLTIGTAAILAGMPKAGTVVLNSANDYTGGTTINAGTLQLNNVTALGSTSAPLTVNAGTTLLMNNQSPTIGNLTGTGGVINSGNSGGRTLTIGQGDTGGGNFQGIYTLGTGGSANLTKVGTGTITLSGPNTYNGTTAINAGTLLINGDQSAATGNVTVAANATLGGTGTLGGNTTIADNGKLQFNLSTAFGSHNGLEIATGKALTLSGASTLTITSSGGASPGLYTLVSGGNNIVGSAPALPNVTLPGGWTADAPVIVGNQLQINITFTGGGLSAYDTWKATNAPSGNPDNDFDGDGVSNAVEFVLGGLATTNDLNKLPLIATDGTNMTFTFFRKQSSIDAKTSLRIETSTDLATWNTAPSPYTVPDGAVTAVPGVTVLKGVPATFDTVTLTVPQDSAKKFARLKVAITP